MIVKHGPVTLLATLAVAVAPFLAPPAAFSIDDVLYIDMAHAMATRGELQVGVPDVPPGAPMLTKSDGLVILEEGRAVPQYPSGYAIFAVPFYLLFGIHGLIMMNALGAVVSLCLTYGIARRLGLNEPSSRTALLLLGAGTIFPGYALGTWPHMSALSFLLGGALLTLRAAQTQGSARLPAALAAGLLFGVGLNFRLDSILLAGAAFFWLRLFAAPSDRWAAVALLVGIVPGVLFAAYLNGLKFGVFQPFSYGKSAGLDSVGSYALFGFFVVAAAVVSLIGDVSGAFLNRLRGTPFGGKVTLATVGAGLCCLLAWEEISRGVIGLWVLLFDIQAYGGERPKAGLIRDPYGWWSFWGLPKKALLQSIPFAALAILPMVDLSRRRNVAQTMFSALMIAAPVLFYSRTSHHGGMAFNLRYFLPCVPFIAILSAQAYSRLRKAALLRRPMLLGCIGAGVYAALVLYVLLPMRIPAAATPLRLYPQLGLFALLAVAVIGAQVGAVSKTRWVLIALALSGSAFGYAGVLGVLDAGGYLMLRSEKMPYERAYANALPPTSLVLTTTESHLVHAGLLGVNVVRAVPGNEEAIREATGAYERAGRCVYVHTRTAEAIVGDDRFEPIPVLGITRDPGELTIFAPPSQPDSCRLTRPD